MCRPLISLSFIVACAVCFALAMLVGCDQITATNAKPDKTKSAPNAAPSQSAAPDPPKLATLQLDNTDVWGEGVWMPDNPTEHNKPFESVTHYTCSRTGGRQLTGTQAWCLESTASIVDGMLNVNDEWMKVVEWNNERVVAVNDSPICLSQQVIFDVKRKTAIALDVRKPEAKGFMDMCLKLPDRQTYYLEDKGDYYNKKTLGKL